MFINNVLYHFYSLFIVRSDTHIYVYIFIYIYLYIFIYIYIYIYIDIQGVWSNYEQWIKIIKYIIYQHILIEKHMNILNGLA